MDAVARLKLLLDDGEYESSIAGCARPTRWASSTPSPTASAWRLRMEVGHHLSDA
jgi:hypothetical protein